MCPYHNYLRAPSELLSPQDQVMDDLLDNICLLPVEFSSYGQTTLKTLEQ